MKPQPIQPSEHGAGLVQPLPVWQAYFSGSVHWPSQYEQYFLAQQVPDMALVQLPVPEMQTLYWAVMQIQTHCSPVSWHPIPSCSVQSVSALLQAYPPP